MVIKAWISKHVRSAEEQCTPTDIVGMHLKSVIPAYKLNNKLLGEQSN